ncbi:MAG TPA: hypothetical protein DD444_02320 [Citreicella sp.]|jgi:hypothetical protein|nr:hypothetical protein [Citreicella sp.]|tara:strand:- start:253 stop:708 length:456 start_codon:yes stop_codon:yes gene_type:complete
MIQTKDIGALILPLRAAGNAAATAGGSGDGTAVPGVILDRAAHGMPQSGVLAVPFTATLAAGETLSVTYTVEEGEAEDMSDATVMATDTVTAATGPAGGGTVTGCLRINVKLRAGGRYLRCGYTPELSAGGSDTAELSALLICGGMDRVPQ